MFALNERTNETPTENIQLKSRSKKQTRSYQLKWLPQQERYGSASGHC